MIGYRREGGGPPAPAPPPTAPTNQLPPGYFVYEDGSLVPDPYADDRTLAENSTMPPGYQFLNDGHQIAPVNPYMAGATEPPIQPRTIGRPPPAPPKPVPYVRSLPRLLDSSSGENPPIYPSTDPEGWLVDRIQDANNFSPPRFDWRWPWEEDKHLDYPYG